VAITGDLINDPASAAQAPKKGTQAVSGQPSAVSFENRATEG